MSRVLFVNGSTHEYGCTYTALHEIAKTLEKQGVTTEIVWIGKRPVQDCTSCGSCRETGRCVFRDDPVDQILDRLDGYDGRVLGSPVYYAGPTGALCSFMDRLFYAGNGRMTGKLAAAVVNARRAGTTAALDRLYKYFSICNMVTVWSDYWNMTFGQTEGQNLQDAEGLQNMRNLGENMAWMLQNLAAGRAAGVPAPAREPRMHTNFVR